MRPLLERDIDETVKLLNAAFEYQKIATGYERTDPNHLKAYMNDLRCFVITDSDRIVATIAFEESENILHFGLMSVAREFRGKGLAQEIMKSIEKYGTQHQFSILELEFMSIAPWLENYYKKYGYKMTGHIREWKGVDLIQMQKEVNVKN